MTETTQPTPARRRLRNTVAALMLGTTVLTGTALVAGPPVSFAATTTEPANANTAAQLPGSFAPLVRKVQPAVVTIMAAQGGGHAERTAEAERGTPDLPFPPGSPFEEFFRRFQDQLGPQGQRPEPRGERGGVSLGSGFIIDAGGYVVTNNHVVDGAREVTVTLDDGTLLPAQVVGHDEKTDLALLKVSSDTPLPYLAFGDSDKAAVGDWVVAVGNPFGLGGTVTTGIVSARGRNINAGPYDDFIQTDAAINRGNSGGPMFNAAGEVIGINTAIFSPSGGSVGIGFAIPSNLAKAVVAQLRDHGHVERGWLGVAVQQVTPELAAGLGRDKAEGALVAQVTPGSPADKAGLHQGDLILGFDGKPVHSMRDLTLRVAETKSGESVAVQVLRDGSERTVTVEIGRLKEERVASAGGHRTESAAATTVKGLALAPLTAAARERLGIGAEVKGVVVTRVDGDAPIQPGDVIEKVGDAVVASPADVSKHVHEAEKAGRKAVLLLVNRDGADTFVALPLRAA